VADLPAAEVEIALVGRSNVGKSSLLNALARRRDLARTSKTPGATRLLNVFEVGPVGSGRWIVDLPGYGYAKVPGSERRRWKDMVEGYLVERPTLDRALVLIDGEVGPTPLDLQTLDWLDEIGLPVRLVATKSDKVKSSRRPARRAELSERLGVARADVAWVSAERGTGIDELRAEVVALLGLS
jgi:GTP-binding protein